MAETELKRVMGRYRVTYDGGEHARTFTTEDAARDFIASIGETAGDVKKNTASGDPLQSGSQDSLDKLAADARERYESQDPIETNAGFTVSPTDNSGRSGSASDGSGSDTRTHQPTVEPPGENNQGSTTGAGDRSDSATALGAIARVVLGVGVVVWLLRRVMA